MMQILRATLWSVCKGTTRPWKEAVKSTKILTKWLCVQSTAKLLQSKQREIALHLQSILKCTGNEVHVILTRFPALKEQSTWAITQQVSLLIDNGVTLQQILDNSCLLLCQPAESQPKLDLVARRIGGLRDVTVPLLTLSNRELVKVADCRSSDAKAGYPDRIEFLLAHLECSPVALGQLLPKHLPLLLMPFNRLLSIMELLKERGISANIILDDLWIFRHNRERMNERLDLLTQHSVEGLRPWMLRCTQKTLSKFIDKWKAHRHVIDPHGDVAEYLAERLGCSVDKVHEDLVKRNPVLLSTSPVKIKQVLDWLFEKGFTAKHVHNSPRIFEVSMDSLQTRFHQLTQCGSRPRRLHILWVEWKIFDQHLRKLKEKNKLKRKNH